MQVLTFPLTMQVLSKTVQHKKYQKKMTKMAQIHQRLICSSENQMSRSLQNIDCQARNVTRAPQMYPSRMNTSIQLLRNYNQLSTKHARNKLPPITSPTSRFPSREQVSR